MQVMEKLPQIGWLKNQSRSSKKVQNETNID